jgi:hypothetical protein
MEAPIDNAHDWRIGEHHGQRWLRPSAGGRNPDRVHRIDAMRDAGGQQLAERGLIGNLHGHPRSATVAISPQSPRNARLARHRDGA